MWVGSEYETLRLVHPAGADVPRPVAKAGSAVLMEYVGEVDEPAPMLSSVTLPGEQAERLFRRLMRNVRIFLSCHRIHADLSAYNVLWWRGKLKVIDFPQAVDSRFNRNAFSLLTRDIGNLCRYFARCGVAADPWRLAGGLWRRYLRAEL